MEALGVAGRWPRSDAGVGENMSLGGDYSTDSLYARRGATIFWMFHLQGSGVPSSVPPKTLHVLQQNTNGSTGLLP